MADKSRDIVTREVLEKASKDVLQEVSEHLYNYVPYTDEEIAEIFDLDEVTAKSLSKVINDEYIAKNKVFSNEHTVELLNQTLADANKFTVEQIANSGNLKRKIVTSTSEVVDETILYLILTDSTNNIYTQYMLIDGNATPLGTTQINLSDYLKTIDFNTKIDEYAKKNTVVLQNDIVGDLTTLSSNQVLSTQGVSDELDKKVDKTSIVTSIDSSSTDAQIVGARTIYEKTKNMCTTTVTDVPWTKLTMDSGMSGSVYYCIKNGICYMYVELLKSSTMSTNNQTIITGLPIPEIAVWYSLISSNPSQGGLLVLIDNTGKMVNNTGLDNVPYFGSFSYPVKEN